MLEPRTMNYSEILERIRDVVLQNMELSSKLKDIFEIEGNKHLETLLLYAMLGLKPVGVNRYFMMTVIHDRFSSYIKKELSSKLIWDYLESLYDMSVLHESEIIPFPNEDVEYELPEELDEMVKEKYGIVVPRPPKDENETPKSNSNLKTVKKFGSSKLKQSTNATASAKNAFQTPVSSKLSKNHLGSRSETKPSSAEISVKGKQESQFPVRVNKVNRASSPFTTKNVKSENGSTSESSSATPVSTSKKSTKIENHNSSSSKKTPKHDSTPSSSTQKKYAKGEPHSSSSKHAKTETPDNYNKKVRSDKEQSSKKGKVSLTAENSTSKKSSKSDVKKVEAEHNHKKSSDISSSKHKAEKERGSTKGSKHDDLESSHSSGSRKSSSGKIDSSDKKKKRQRIEDSAKKGTPPAKRRRTLNS